MKSAYSLTPKGRAARLRKVADFVERIPPESFTLNHWWLPEGLAFDDERNKMYRVAPGPCGCPIGHMAQKGMFGLTESVYKPLPGVTSAAYPETVFVAVGDLFAVPMEVAQFIFSQYAYNLYLNGSLTYQEAVVRRIRFVAAEILLGGAPNHL